MRCDQVIGLNPWAKKLVNKSEAGYEIVKQFNHLGDLVNTFRRNIEIPSVKKEVYGHFVGMFQDEYPLHRYIFDDGSDYEEYVQAEPWSSGPCFFLALRHYSTKEPLPNSLWPEIGINNA